MNARESAISRCRAILDPSFGRYWDGLDARSKKWFLGCAGLPHSGAARWSTLKDEEKAKVRAAWSAFMYGPQIERQKVLA